MLCYNYLQIYHRVKVKITAIGDAKRKQLNSIARTYFFSKDYNAKFLRSNGVHARCLNLLLVTSS